MSRASTIKEEVSKRNASYPYKLFVPRCGRHKTAAPIPYLFVIYPILRLNPNSVLHNVSNETG